MERGYIKQENKKKKQKQKTKTKNGPEEFTIEIKTDIYNRN